MQQWRIFAYAALLALVPLGWCLDVVHGIALGENHVISSPIYRIRQTLAVALTRLDDPPLGGYVSYRSIVDALNDHGFAIFPDDNGLHLSLDGWIALFNNGPKLDHIITEVERAPVDQALPPDLIRGNELGYADYMVVAFRLFGTRIEAFYDFYFVIVALSCLTYTVAFYRAPFFLFLLIVWEAALFFLIDYAQANGLELNTICNSRLFSALTLPAAAHVLFVLWHGAPLRKGAALLVVVQCAIFAFIVSSRYEAVWQAFMVYAAGALIGTCALWRHRAAGVYNMTTAAAGRVWPALFLAAAVLVVNLHVAIAASPLYAEETESHIFWHEVLMGLLSASPRLQQIYLGHVEPAYSDTMVYEAVTRDLVSRGITGEPDEIVRDGTVSLDLWRGWKYYERLTRSLTLRIVVAHPFLVLRGFYQKIVDQIDWYSTRGGLAPNFFRIPAILVLAAAVAAALAGGLAPNRRELSEGVLVMTLVLAFAAITPMIEPSALAVGTLICYFVAGVVVTVITASALVSRFASDDAGPGRGARST